MSKNSRIPRTRHLFPEAAVWFINAKRGLLRLQWMLREDQDWIPAWSIGAVAGVSGLMLAILLFFLDDPHIVAAPAKQTEPPAAEIIFPEAKPVQPILDPEFNGVFPIQQSGQADLSQSVLLRTRLPYYWDQRELASVESIHKRIVEPFRKDDWTRTTPDFNLNDEFRPYLISGATLPLVPSKLMANGIKTEFDGIPATRAQGIKVEKLTPPKTTVGESSSYIIQITNVSTDVIEEVFVHEKISDMHRVTQTEPPASVQGDELVWNLGRFTPHNRKALRVTIKPDKRRQIITETRLLIRSRFGDSVYVSEPEIAEEPELLPVQPAPIEPTPLPVSEAPKPFPELVLNVTPTGVIKRGAVLTLHFQVSNIGTAPAENVTLYVDLSDELKHKYGERVKHTITRLEPGQVRHAKFQAIAEEAGMGQLSASLQMAGNEEKSEQVKIQIEPTSETYTQQKQAGVIALSDDQHTKGTLRQRDLIAGQKSGQSIWTRSER